MTFYKRLQAILEGYSINTDHQVTGGIDLSNAVSAFDGGCLTYNQHDTDFDIIKVGNKANPTERVSLHAYDNSKDKLQNSKVQILHPFEVNVNYNGRLTITIEKTLSDAIACNGRNLTYDLESGNFVGSSIHDDQRTIAALGLMRQMQTDKKISRILADVEETPAAKATSTAQKKDSRGTVNVVKFLKELKDKFFYTYRKNAGIAIAQRLKKIATLVSGGGVSVTDYDQFMDMCAYALRNVTQAKAGERAIVYDFIIKPESSSNFNDELINALKSNDAKGKSINKSCTNAQVITIQKLRSAATASMSPAAKQAADEAHIDNMLATAELELRNNILNQLRAPYAVVEYVQCPTCGFQYGKTKINKSIAWGSKDVAYNSKSDYSENSPDLRTLGNSGCGTTCGNPGTTNTKTNTNPCPGLIDSLGTRLKLGNEIAGIKFQRITRAARQTRAGGEQTEKFPTWGALADDWAATEFRKLRADLINKATGIKTGNAVKIAHTFGDKRRYVKLYGQVTGATGHDAFGQQIQLSVINGKNCLLIDDNVAGGSTIELIEQIVQNYQPNRVDAFVPLKLAD